MERLSDLSLMAAIALENLLHDRKASSVPIREFVSALEADQLDPADRVKALMSDYRRVDLYNQAWQRLTGNHLEQLGELVTQISSLLRDMQSDLASAPEGNIKYARDFCLALNRALVDADYENLNATATRAPSRRV